MLQVTSLLVDTIHPHGNKFVTGVKIKPTGGSNLNELLLIWILNKLIKINF